MVNTGMSSVCISPSIRITESFEQRGIVPVAENAFVAGFTQQGPSDLPYFIDSVNDWINLFGKPDPAAPEQAYAYNAAESIINSGANLIFTRLPYGADEGETVGDTYSALVYPVQDCDASAQGVSATVTGYKSTSFVPFSAFNLLGTFASASATEWGVSNQDMFNGTTLTPTQWGEISGLPVLEEVAGVVELPQRSSYFLTGVSGTDDPWNGTIDYTEFVPPDGDFAFELSATVLGMSGKSLSVGTILTGDEWANVSAGDVVSLSARSAIISDAVATTEVNETPDDVVLFSAPFQATLSQADYDAIQCGEFDWSGTFTCDPGSLSAYDPDTFGQAGMVVIDKSRSITNRQFEGMYLTVTDNYDADPASVWNSVSGLQYADESANWQDVPNNFYNFALSGDEVSNNAAVSRTVESLGNQGVDGQWENSEFKDHLNITLWRLIPNEGDVNDLIPVVVESHVGSLDEDRTVSDFGVPKSVFLQNNIARDSARLDLFVNPNITGRLDWANVDGDRTLATRMNRVELGTDITSNCNNCGARYADNMYGLSRYVPKTNTVARDVGNIPAKLASALCGIDNPEVIDINYTVDSGLSTIWTTVRTDRNQWETNDPRDNSFVFDDGVNIDVIGDLGRAAQTVNGGNGGSIRPLWQTIFDQFNTFVKETRPCNGGVAAVHVADPLRHIFVQGRDCKVWKGDKDAASTFNELIYHPLKNLYSGVNTSHAVSYANWFKDVVVAGGSKLCWLPPSGKMTQVIANTPNVWTAAAGVNNGIIEGVKDLALNPRLRDRDQLFKIQVNAIYNDRDYGIMAFAQQTLNRPNTMARELYVRRTLLWLQNNAVRIMKPYQFEPNTVFVRTKIRNALTPHYARALAGGALEDFEISFDANTPNELQNGILKISFLLKFAGIIKCVRLDYHSVNSETPFSEVIL